ncbi:MAG: hypothetical protein L0Z49_14420 [Actinobacteria bacterium]|nr:hypothetical protein [Actinomycetota bacterium]
MSRSVLSRLFALALLLLAGAVPVAALATEADTESTTTAATTGDEVVPAVEAPPAEEEEEDVPWTTRFLAPATLALGVVGVVGAAAYYGARVAGKYRVDRT